jgi:hypothetical protein
MSITNNLASNRNSQALLFLKQLKNSIRNFNDNWAMWRNLLKNPNDIAISFIIDSWDTIIRMEFITYRNFWAYIFKNPNDKLIDFLDVEWQKMKIDYQHKYLKYLLNNKNKKAIKLFEKLISIYGIRRNKFTTSTSNKYLKNPNIFDVVQIPLNNEYVKLLNY